LRDRDPLFDPAASLGLLSGSLLLHAFLISGSLILTRDRNTIVGNRQYRLADGGQSGYGRFP
jgi:hypothetical protein